MNRFQDIFDSLKAREQQLAETTPQERIEKVNRLYQAVYELRAEAGEAGMKEVGQDGRGQLIPLKDHVADTRAHLADWMKPQPYASASLGAKTAHVQFEPKGVVLHLATWNAPVLICLSPLISMIQAGNAVVLKPSEVAPHSAEVVRKIIEKAGLTDDVAVITGGPDVAEELLKLPFNHICYVGNNRIGRLVMRAAAEHFAGVTLEMGGKNPVYVAADADLDDAAAKIAYGKMYVGGQACLCLDYVLADASIKDELAAKIQAKAAAFYDSEGDGFRSSRQVGRIVNERHAQRIKGLIDDAVAKGSTLRYGGEVDVDQRFVTPTLLDGISDDMEIFHEEIFGPVMTIQAVSGRDEALQEIRKRPKPLGAYVFSRSQDVIDWFVQNTRAGSTAINNIAVQATVSNLPFGGANHSGIGLLNGEAGFREFSNVRGTVVDVNDASAPSQNYPPYPPEMVHYIDMMLNPETIGQ
jgi:aldehyde dehydrogenase (NAD+)